MNTRLVSDASNLLATIPPSPTTTQMINPVPEIRIKIKMALTGNLFLFGSDNKQNKIC